MPKSLLIFALSFASVGILSAASVSPQTTFTGGISLTSNQYDDYFVYNGNGGDLSGSEGIGVTNPFTGQTHYVPAGTFAVSESVPEYISSGVATAIGLYSSTGVSVAVNQSLYNTALGTETWDQVFAGTSESSIVTALQGGDEAALQSFLSQYSTDFISFSANNPDPIAGGILHFSNAADGGSLTLTSITAVGGPDSSAPEPSTELLLSAGLGLVVLATRKLRKQ
ncbi:MAG: hypothetical protein WA324_25910 [Bryobacteraceae bacterium]